MLWLRPKEGEVRPYEGITKAYAYHIGQFETAREIWKQVSDYALAMGLDMIQGDCEDAPGQVELNYQFDDALATCDRMTTYRQICAEVARQHRLIARFMAKPFMGYAANGCHHNCSVWTRNTREAQHLVEGDLPGMEENWMYSTGGVNEFENTDGGWLPTELGHPHLLCCALLKAMQDGIDNQIDPGAPEDRNVTKAWQEGGEVKLNLHDALEALMVDDVVKTAMPGGLYDLYDEHKRDEWTRFLREVTNWDVERYLHCVQ